MGCGSGFGFSSSRDDCDDMNKEVHPGIKETCNSRDDDCNGRVDDGARAACGVGWCRRLSPTCEASACVPGPPRAETCNAFDDDCDGVVDNGSNLCMEGRMCMNGFCLTSQEVAEAAAAEARRRGARGRRRRARRRSGARSRGSPTGPARGRLRPGRSSEPVEAPRPKLGCCIGGGGRRRRGPGGGSCWRWRAVLFVLGLVRGAPPALLNALSPTSRPRSGKARLQALVARGGGGAGPLRAERGGPGAATPGGCPGWAAREQLRRRGCWSRAGSTAPNTWPPPSRWPLLERAEAEPELRRLRERAELWVIPCLNPDGYARVWQRGGVGRLPELRPNARGVDLNRNFPLPAGRRRLALPGRGIHPAGGRHLRRRRPAVRARDRRPGPAA